MIRSFLKMFWPVILFTIAILWIAIGLKENYRLDREIEAALDSLAASYREGCVEPDLIPREFKPRCDSTAATLRRFGR